MPLQMPTQILGNMGTAYVQSKALRLQQEEVKKESGRADARVGLEQQRVDIANDLNTRQQEQAGRDAEIFGAKKVYGWTMQYAQTHESAGEQAASDEILESLKPLYDDMPDGQGKAELGKMIEDGFISSDEVGRAHKMSASILDRLGDPKADYTLGKGRYSGETNELIAGLAPTEGSDSSRQRDDEIRDAEAIFSKDGHPDPHRAAIEFVDDGYQVLISPSDNTVYKRNKFTDELTIMKPEDTRGPAPTVPYENTLHAIAEDATGLGPWFAAAVAKGTSPADIKALRAEKTVKAKAKFLAAENAVIEAFRLNPRYPEGEVLRIQKRIDIKPKMWDSAFQMRARMAGSREYLTEKLKRLDYYLLDPAITAKKREDDTHTRDSINEYLSVLGKPPAPTPELKDLPPVPEGVAPEDWRYMSPEDRSLWD